MHPEIFFQYYELAQQGHVVPIECIDDHGMLHPFVDLDTNKPYMECLFCDYRISPGILMEDSLRKAIAEAWEEHYGADSD